MQQRVGGVLYQRTQRLNDRARFVAVAWFIVLLFFVAPAKAVDLAAARLTNTAEDPKQFVRELTRTVLVTMSRERNAISRNGLRIYEIVDEIIAPHIDTHRVSKLVLGKHWGAANPTQRRQFQSAMSSRIVQTLVKGISAYVDVADPKNTEIRFLASRPNASPQDVTVRSRLGGSGTPSIRVDFRLHQVDGRWFFYDVVIAGASLILTYRRDYVAEVERSGIERVIELAGAETPSAYRGHATVGEHLMAGN